MKSVAELLAPRDILLDITVADKAGLLEKIAEHMEWVHGLPREAVLRSLLHREQIGSTALGQGIAIPHARIPELNRIQLAYLRLKPPIAFDAPDGKPVSDVLVILVPRQASEEHLRILADTSQVFSDARFREQLHRCVQPDEVKQLFDARPRSFF